MVKFSGHHEMLLGVKTLARWEASRSALILPLLVTFGAKTSTYCGFKDGGHDPTGLLWTREYPS
jgi:hypothetical protein